jgi:two-component system OmpR family sensor kinase
VRRALPTLHSRLARRALAYTLLALAIVGVVAWVATDRVISDRTTTSAEDYLLTLTSELEIASSPTDANVRAPIARSGADQSAQIVDLVSGEVVVSTADLPPVPLIEPAVLAGEATITSEIRHPDSDRGRLLLKATTVTVNGRRFGVIAGVESSPSLSESGIIVASAVAAAMVIAFGLASAVWISVRSALRPVENLADEADQLASNMSAESWALENQATTAEIDHLVRRLNSLLLRVHESQENERAFLEDASHDLRTPIAVARAELDLASSTTTEAETRSALESAIEELDRLDRLAADLLVLARMRAQPTSAVEMVHVGHLVRQTAARKMRDPQHRPLEVTVEGSADMRGDPFMLERAVDNVLSNAIRHASSHVDVAVESSGGTTSIRVGDDGPGFTDALISSAAQRFTRDTKHGEGAGLGLAIAAAIAEAHGGSISLGNRSEGGAEVTLRLPSTIGTTDLDRLARDEGVH